MYIIILCLLSSFSLFAKEKLVINSIESNYQSKLCAKIITAAYKKLDIEIEIQNISGLTTLKSSIEGKSDGETCRVKDLVNIYPELKMVTSPLIKFKGVLLYDKEKIKIKHLNELKNYKIGVLKGLVYSEKQPMVWIVFF